MKTCRECEGPIPKTRRPQATYCSPRCAKRKEARRYYAKNGSRSMRPIVIELLGGKCFECGKDSNIQIDHIIPFDKGGRNEKANIQLLCKKCHTNKTKKEALNRTNRGGPVK